MFEVGNQDIFPCIKSSLKTNFNASPAVNLAIIDTNVTFAKTCHSYDPCDMYSMYFYCGGRSDWQVQLSTLPRNKDRPSNITALCSLDHAVIVHISFIKPQPAPK